MFDRRSNDVFSYCLFCIRGAEDRCVVAFRSATIKNDLVGFDT